MGKHAFEIFGTCLSVLAIFLFVSQAMAMAGWTRTYSGESMDILTPTSIAQTNDGGYVTAISGLIRRIDNLGYLGHFSQYDELQILKTNSNGDVQWTRNFTVIEDPNHVTQAIYPFSGKYVVVQTSDGGYSIASSSNSYFWMFKVSSQGNVLWSKSYNPTDESSSTCLYSMIQTTDGGFALTGSAVIGDDGSNFWLVKTDSQGNLQWDQNYNSGTYKNAVGDVCPREDEAKGIVQNSDGGYALVGSASLYRDSTSSIVYASWLVKTDAQGKLLWNKGYDLPNDHSRDFSLVQTAEGGYAIAGTQNNDFCLLRVDSVGQLQWSKTYGDSDTDTPCALVQLDDNGYALAGTWTEINATATASTMRLLRVNSSGQTIWTKTYNAKQNSPTLSYDLANAMVLSSDGSYAIAGSTVFNSETHQDIFLVKTETLEQPPKITPVPAPTAFEPATTPNPTSPTEPSLSPTPTSSNPIQSSSSPSASSSNPTQPSQTQNPYSSNTPNSNTTETAFPEGTTPTTTQSPSQSGTGSEAQSSPKVNPPRNTNMTQDGTSYAVAGTILAAAIIMIAIFIIKTRQRKTRQ